MSCWKPKTDHVDIEPPHDIEDLFRDSKYSDKGVMSVEQFQMFLREFQGEDKALAEVENIIKGLDYRRISQQKGLNVHDFFAYLFGDNNQPLRQQVHQDMNGPIAQYFIHTRVKIRVFSARKGQLKPSKSKRSIAAIREALNMGVRVIQLDLSHTEKKNNGGINHNSPDECVRSLIFLVIRGTLRNYMEAIKDHAFNSQSVYPVILVFEGDFGSTIQSHVAELVQTIFAGILHDPESDQKLLSPQNLLNKILLAHPPKQSHQQRIQSGFTNSTNNMKFEKDEKTDKYKSLINIEDVKIKRSLSETLAAEYDRIRCFGLTQQDLERAVKTNEDQIIKFTKKNLLAVYPVDKLSGSKNCNPLTGWSHGAQMVASNFQGRDKYLGVMQGMFRGNGGCGYVKKPDILLKDDVDYKIFDLNTTLITKTTLKVKIYMGDGWHLDFPATKFDILSPPDFFLKVQVFGVAADNAKEETELEQDKWRPNWNQEFQFPLKVPELAMLRIEARDLDDDMSHDFGGQTCLPVMEIQKGVRTVPLYNKKGRMYNHVRLLVRFEFDHHC